MKLDQDYLISDHTIIFQITTLPFIDNALNKNKILFQVMINLLMNFLIIL